MANINYYIDILKSGSGGGRSARNLMIDIFNSVQDNGPDAKTFNGKTADEYISDDAIKIKEKEIESKIVKDDAPDETSENLLMTKGIMLILGDLEQYPTS